MRFLTEIVDALAGFVQRNPLTVLLVVVLAVGAPALLKGIALFILYFFMGLLLLVVAGLLFFRWRVCKMRREMEERFGREFGPERPGGFRQGFGGGAPRTPREGETGGGGRGRLRRFRGDKRKQVNDAEGIRTHRALLHADGKGLFPS